MRTCTIAAVAAALALSAVLLGCAVTESREPPALDRLTLDEEVALGRAAAPAVERGLGRRLEHLAVQAYVRTVGQRVARATHLSDLPYRFTVLDTAEARGVALPGGVVYVTRGLLVQLDTEAQLAAALARQVAHLAAGHVRHGLGRAMDLPTLRRAAAAGAVPAENGSAVEAAERVAAKALALAWSPDQEAEADRLGLDYLAAAGYNPPQMAECLRRLGAPQDRIDQVRAAAGRKYPDRPGRVAGEEYRRGVLDRLRLP